MIQQFLVFHSFWWTKKQTWINLHNKQRWINIPVLAPVTIAVLPCNLTLDTKGFFMDTSYSFTAVRTIPTNKQNPQNMEIRSIAIFKDCNFKEALILAFSLTDQIYFHFYKIKPDIGGREIWVKVYLVSDCSGKLPASLKWAIIFIDSNYALVKTMTFHLEQCFER